MNETNEVFIDEITPDKKIEHPSPLCKVLDEAKYVFGDDKNIDIDELCQYIRNAYITESEVQE
jgi:hypothetical protein